MLTPFTISSSRHKVYGALVLYGMGHGIELIVTKPIGMINFAPNMRSIPL